MMNRDPDQQIQRRSSSNFEEPSIHNSDPFSIPPVDPNDPLQDLESVIIDVDRCNVTIGKDLYRPKPYQAPLRLERTNERAVRFGRTNDMMALLQGTENSSEYVFGLVATSMLIGIVFVFFCSLIVVWKVLGYQKVGFLSGRFVQRNKPRPISQPNDNDDADDEAEEADELNAPCSKDENTDDLILEEKTNKEEKSDTSIILETIKDENQSADFHATSRESPDENSANDVDRRSQEGGTEEQKDDDDISVDASSSLQRQGDKSKVIIHDYACLHHEQERRMFRTRVAFSLATICTFVSAVLFLINGTYYVNQSFDAVKTGLQYAQDLCQGGIQLIDDFMMREEEVTNITKAQLNAFNTICPKAFESVCTNLDPIENCDFSQLPVSDLLRESFRELFQALYQKIDFIFEDVLDMRQDLVDLSETFDRYLNGEFQLEWAYWVSFAFTLALGVLCIFHIGMIVLMHLKASVGQFLDLIRRRVLFPVWIFFVLMASAFAIAFVIAAIGASDFCINSPDPKVTVILSKNQDRLDSLVYSLAKYYVNGCDPDLYPEQFERQTNSTIDILKQANSFLELLDTIDEETWLEQCGTDVSLLLTLIETLERSFCLLSLTLEDVKRFFWCRHWSPAYVVSMHDAVCNDAQTGLAWIATTMLFVVLFSMITVTLRAAIFELEDEGDPQQAILNKEKKRLWFYNRRSIYSCFFPVSSKQGKALGSLTSDADLQQEVERNAKNHCGGDDDEADEPASDMKHSAD
ncbi:hypothetical protein ACA910_005574 [Epithemia clementina (nom. ined.)]